MNFIIDAGSPGVSEARTAALQDELDNFAAMAAVLKAQVSDTPVLEGIEVAGFTIPFAGSSGGDHIAYLDFNRQCDLPARILEAERQGRFDIVRNLQASKTKAGILIADVSGHRRTDAFLAGMLHQAFLTGVLYELEQHGSITSRLFENLSVRFQDYVSIGKFITVLYGEIDSSGRFRFISAGHDRPLIFSREHDCFVEVGMANVWQYPPLGMTPFEHVDRAMHPHPLLGFQGRYEVNVLELLGSGDILLLSTDGLTEHAAAGTPYIGARLEENLRQYKSRPLQDLASRLEADIREFGPIEDDLSVVLIRKTA